MCAAGLGTVVTVLGWDLLTFTQAESRGVGGFGVILLDVFALPIAAVGMTVPCGGRCGCRRGSAECSPADAPAGSCSQRSVPQYPTEPAHPALPDSAAFAEVESQSRAERSSCRRAYCSTMGKFMVARRSRQDKNLSREQVLAEAHRLVRDRSTTVRLRLIDSSRWPMAIQMLSVSPVGTIRSSSKRPKAKRLPRCC